MAEKSGLHRTYVIRTNTWQLNGKVTEGGLPVPGLTVHISRGTSATRLTQQSSTRTDTDGNYKTAGGLHGVGASVVNALSKELVATIRRDGAEWEMRFKQGQPTGPVKKLGPARGTGTKPATMTAVIAADLVRSRYDTFAVERLFGRASLSNGVVVVDTLGVFERGTDALAELREARFDLRGGVEAPELLAGQDKAAGQQDGRGGSLDRPLELHVGDASLHGDSLGRAHHVGAVRLG